MAADFSHYSLTDAQMVARYVSRGRRPTDEMLLEAFDRLNPLLLPDAEQRYVRTILSHKRGPRPRIEQSKRALARKLELTKRSDAPPEYLKALSARLLKTRGLREYQRSVSFYWKHEQRTRDMFIRSLYRQFFKLDDGSEEIVHPITGRVAVPQARKQKSKRTLAMVREVVGDRFGYFIPSDRRMMNIIAGC